MRILWKFYERILYKNSIREFYMKILYEGFNKNFNKTFVWEFYIRVLYKSSICEFYMRITRRNSVNWCGFSIWKFTVSS